MLVPCVRPSSISGRRRVAVFGSTGSIGVATVDLLQRYPDQFEPFALVAGSNTDLLVAQARQLRPRYVAIATSENVGELRARLVDLPIEVLGGTAEIAALAGHPEVDTVVAAIVGAAGLPSVLAAAEAGKQIALANKESLVCGGALVRAAAQRSGATIVPVDSEHSALFQCLQGSCIEEVAKLVLTASGGPFLHRRQEDLANITPEEAARHPRWAMGVKVSIDSSNLMNKALELIEAHWLFGTPADRIDVLIHPQSAVHSLVQLTDGSLIAQLGVNDMRGPISYALSYPNVRLTEAVPPLDLAQLATLQFLPLDDARFPAVGLARSALRDGGAVPAVFNAANEAAVAAFRAGALRYDRIVPLVEAAMVKFSGTKYSSLEELEEVTRQVLQYCATVGKEAVPTAALHG